MLRIVFGATLLLAAPGGCTELRGLIDHGTIGTNPSIPPASPLPAPPASPADPRGSPAVLASRRPPPIFADWWYMHPETMRATRKPTTGDPCAVVERVDYRSPEMYIPVSTPGAAHGGPSYASPEGWYSWYARCYAHALDEAGAPLAVLIRERNCPFPYADRGLQTAPGEVAGMLDVLPKLDYLIMDLEPIHGGTPQDVIRNVEEIVRLVRSHPNPRINRAFLGNYNDFPGEHDGAVIWPDRRDRTAMGPTKRWDRDAFYRANLNVAMPSLYPYQIYSRHAHAPIQRGPTSPNERAASFWAPLERLSVAARNLPEGHLLIPWVSNYGAFDGESEVYTAPPPTRDDLEAFIRHVRLRGAYSYFIWTSNPDQTDHPTIDRKGYMELALSAWKSLNPLFAGGGAPRILNLETDKVSGVQWSGMIVGDQAWVLVSNLGKDDGARVRLPTIAGLPAETPAVPRNTHRLFRWRLPG